MSPRPIIAPSVLASDLSCLKDEAQRMLDEGCDWLHLDVMWVEPMAAAGASSATFHFEAVGSSEEEAAKLFKEIRSKGMRAGLSLKPNTDIQLIENLLKNTPPDLLLIMTVEPGFGGQKFMHQMMPKVKRARALCPDLNIQVDGGLDKDTVRDAAENGANVIVAGTSLYKCESPRVLMEYMRDVIVAAQDSF